MYAVGTKLKQVKASSLHFSLPNALKKQERLNPIIVVTLQSRGVNDILQTLVHTTL